MKQINYPLISIQILNWNRAEETVRAIHSAKEQSYQNVEIIVIDNNSKDNSIDLISTTFPDILIIKLDHNYGCPGGRNRGVEYCNGDYIFYLDNDGVLHVDAVMEAYHTISVFDNVAVVTGLVKDFDHPNEIDTQCNKSQKSPYESYGFQGGICLHKKEVYSKAGYYPDHFIYGAEESFLTYKLIDCGYKIMRNENVILWHKRSDVARNKTNEQLNAYNNRLYTAIVLYPLKYAISFVGYFYFKYWYYAYKDGFTLKFFKFLFNDSLSTIRKAIKNRNPINVIAYQKIHE